MTSYSDVLTVRIDPAINQMITAAAVARGTRPAEWTRQAIRTALRLDGFDPVTIPPRDAGALYDIDSDGKRRYARLKDGEICGLYYHAGKPDDAAGYTWLPVTHEDSEPFDIARHWRLKPHCTLVHEYDTPVRVIVSYPVVDKSMEYA